MSKEVTCNRPTADNSNVTKPVRKSEVINNNLMAVVGMMACQFSDDGKYFAQITVEGKLKIWNTYTSTFEQEFTPNFHLTASCTCLHFISVPSTKQGSPRKKKRRESVGETNTSIALGTSSGRLLIYSLAKGDLDYTVDSTTNQYIHCISSSNDEYVYTGVDTSVLVWNLFKRNISSKWVTGNDKVVGILTIPDSDRLLTASKCVKLWSISSQQLLKTYIGHSSLVTLLYYVQPVHSTGDAYVISGSKGDRLLSCWNLSEEIDGKNAIANFLMEDIVNNLSVNTAPDGSTHLAATVRSGVVHIYQHTLNGKKCNKPIKPKTTIQVVTDSKENEAVCPIHIAAATYRDTVTLCICYGSAIRQTFEDIKISTYKKLQCLLRENFLKQNAPKENQISKVRTPAVGSDVHYLSSQITSITTKRKNDGQQEVPMEKRLENLMVTESDSGKVPKANNLAKLLIQGLHSKDKNILQTVLLKKDEQLIKNTIKRIPIEVIPPLFEELTKLIQGKTMSRQIGIMWVKHLILIHTSLLMANPDLSTIFAEILRSIEAGLALQVPRNQLMGRLEMLVSQISNVSEKEFEDNEPALIFNDKVSSDSDNDEMEFEEHLSSENEWEVQNSEDDENNTKMKESDNEDQSESDEAMSV